MTKNEANKVASCVVDLAVVAENGLEIGSGAVIDRVVGMLMSIDAVKEWVGYHLEVMEDKGGMSLVAALRAIEYINATCGSDLRLESSAAKEKYEEEN